MGEPLAADDSISVSAARLRGTASCHKSVAPETHADGLLGRVPFSKPDFEGVWLRLAARLGHFVTPSVARYPAPFVRHLHSFLCFNMPANTRHGLKAQKAARAAAEAKRASNSVRHDPASGVAVGGVDGAAGDVSRGAADAVERVDPEYSLTPHLPRKFQRDTWNAFAEASQSGPRFLDPEVSDVMSHFTLVYICPNQER